MKQKNSFLLQIRYAPLETVWKPGSGRWRETCVSSSSLTAALELDRPRPRRSNLRWPQHGVQLRLMGVVIMWTCVHCVSTSLSFMLHGAGCRMRCPAKSGLQLNSNAPARPSLLEKLLHFVQNAIRGNKQREHQYRNVVEKLSDDARAPAKWSSSRSNKWCQWSKTQSPTITSCPSGNTQNGCS